MSACNEDNFLEEIMPLLRKKQGPDWCPDAAMLCALAEDNTTEAVKDAFAVHKAVCPACANLFERLRSFDEAGSVNVPTRALVAFEEPEWSQTERLLDNWLESFLASEAPVPAVSRVKQPGPGFWWQRLIESLGSLQTRWMLVPAATLALVVCSFLAGRISVRRTPQVITKAVPPKEAIADATTPPTAIQDIPSERKAITGQQDSQAPPAHPPLAQPNHIVSDGLRMMKSVHGSGASRGRGETAIIAPPTSTSAEVSSSPVIASPPPPAPTEAKAVPAPPYTAPKSDTASSDIPGRPVNLGAFPAVPTAGLRSVVAPRTGSPSAFVEKPQPPAIPAPAEVSLAADTRVWISLKSIRQRGMGVSEFSGALLLPVVQSGAMVLDRGTQVSGTVRVRQGKASVQITEFVSNGARYRLKGTGGEANTRGETGPAVKFDAGKVLETWIVSASIFGKLPEEVRPYSRGAVMASPRPASGQNAARPAATPAAKPQEK
jgi:hypothetical protein